MIEPQANMEITWAPRLQTILSWFESTCGEAFLCGEAAQKLISPEGLIPPRSGEIAISKVESSLWNRLQDHFPDLDCEPRNGEPSINLPTEPGSELRIRLSGYRSAQGSDEGNDGEATIFTLLKKQGVTLQAFALKPGGDLIDPYQGVEDYQAKTLRVVENPRMVFREQPEMLMRVAGYIAQYGYEPDKETTRFASRDAANIMSVERSLWTAEMNKILMNPHLDLSMEWLLSTGILKFLLPEVVSLVDFHKSCAVHHKDCWDHTIKVTKKANQDLCTKWAALCHDIGKIWTRSVDRNRQVHFYRHEEFGSLLFEGIAARFQMDEDLAFRVASVIKLHGRVNLYESNWTDSAIRRLIRDSGEHLEDLVRFSKADFTSKRPERIATIQRQLNELEVRIAEIKTESLKKPALPKGLGTALISELGIKPGPDLGHLRRGLDYLCSIEKILTEQDSDYYVELVRSMGIEELIEIGKEQHKRSREG